MKAVEPDAAAVEGVHAMEPSLAFVEDVGGEDGGEFSLGQGLDKGEPTGKDPTPVVRRDILDDAHLEVEAAEKRHRSLDGPQVRPHGFFREPLLDLGVWSPVVGQHVVGEQQFAV